MASNQQQQQAIGQEERRVDKNNKANGSTTITAVYKKQKGASKMECAAPAALLYQMHQTKEYSFAVVVRGARGKRSKMRRRVSAFLLSYAATAMYDDHSCTSKKKDYHEGVAC